MFYRNITKFCRSIHFALVTQINLQQLFIPCALRKKHQNFYYIYLLKQRFLQMAFKIFPSWF